MATLVLSAAGAAVGGAIGGSVLGVSAASIGQAAGAVAGSLIDQRVLGGGSRAVETGRARNLRLQASTEGAPIPVVYGRMRVAGQVIWSTRFRERVSTSTASGGGKGTGGGGGATRVREFRYSISLAVALCEGPIERIGRVWADGKLVDMSKITHRIHTGDAAQMPDPKIEAVEGAGRVPAYRGTAYVVFEDLQLAPYGNRIPQFNFEVYRGVVEEGLPLDPEEAGQPLRDLVRGVALSPGTGEFALETEPVQYVAAGAPNAYANVNNTEGRPDLLVALDQMEGDAPAVDQVSLIISWFGSDLRCGECQIQPKAERAGRKAKPYNWSAAGLTSSTAPIVSRDGEDRPNFGGAPSDRSIIAAITELKARGKAVMLYPFLLMDIDGSNSLPDPYGGGTGQPVFPWRGRITLETAPGQPGSSDQTAAAASEVASFFGTASASDFTTAGGEVTYSGPAEWGWRRFVLHLAALSAAAGGVEAFCIGSEFRGLTQIRSAKATYPAVDQFRALAAEVRQLLPDAKITYAADWSEYFGHQPGDGTGDAIFHLDPLWADPNIDMVGIDDYTPLADWRHSTSHLDAENGAKSVYSLPYLAANIEGGEQYDWYYASQADRDAQIRTPIADTAHGEDWLFRPKDLRGWWANPHHNRIDGVRQTSPTAWVPQSKPIWLTETGCPAVDLGANQPNVFSDGKSSESGLPHYSLGARDDEMQRRFLQAKLGHWDDPARNPASGVYAGRMIPAEGVFVWTWDARPWPDFPVRQSIWSDGPAHRLGHWLSGRISAGSLAAVVADICRRSGLSEIDVGGLYGAVDGYLIEQAGTGRQALQPLMLAYGFEAYESAGQLVFRMRGAEASAVIETGRLATTGEADDRYLELTRASAGGVEDVVRLSYVQAENDYRVGAAEARLPGGNLNRVAETSMELSLPGSKAQATATRWLLESHRARDRAGFALPPSRLAVEPGDVLALSGAEPDQLVRVERIADQGARAIEAVRIEPSLYLPVAAPERLIEPEITRPPGPVEVAFLDIPLAQQGAEDHWPFLAAHADPWPGDMAVYRSQDGENFELVATLDAPAAMGATLEDLPAGQPNRWQRGALRVSLPPERAESRARLSVLNGANRLAVEYAPGEWELMQFREAELTAPGEMTLSRLLRGQRGTEALSPGLIPAGARVVLLDDAVAPVPVSPEEIGLARIWRIGPQGLAVSDPAYLELTATAGGAGLRPFAPVHLRAARQGNGDIAIGWIRQTRTGGDSWLGLDVPLGEEAEAYRVRLFQGGTLLRAVETTAPDYLYSAADQAADGASGPLTFRIAQRSNLIGYGPERELDFDG